MVKLRLMGGTELYGNFFYGDTVPQKRDGITACIEELLGNGDDGNQLSVWIKDLPMIERMLSGKPSDLVLQGHIFIGTEHTLQDRLQWKGYITEEENQECESDL